MRCVELIESKRKILGREVRVGFLGFGVTNRALYEALSPLGLSVTVRGDGDLAPTPEGVRLIEGCDALRDIDEDILFLSPSVRRDRPELVRAGECGVLLTSECEVFFDGYDGAFCVTGSDGKSTTVAMAADMLGLPAVGNIGVPYSAVDTDGGCVAELSSFNLTYLAPFSRRCVITNITENHLDWHRDFDEYREAKRNIIKNAESVVLSADDRECEKLARDGCFALFSAKRRRRELLREYDAEHLITLEDGWVCIDGEPLARESEMARREQYNILNFMAAVGLSLGYAPRERVVRVAREFTGLAHRGALVSHRNIDFIDSSIDTTPSRTAQTLLSLNRRVRVILGGRGKGLSLEPLREPLVKYADVIGVYGELRESILELLSGDERLAKIPLVVGERLCEVLDGVCDGLRAGDTVLLSPSGTGYGEFRDYAERGESFLGYVNEKYKSNEEE